MQRYKPGSKWLSFCMGMAWFIWSCVFVFTHLFIHRPVGQRPFPSAFSTQQHSVTQPATRLVESTGTRPGTQPSIARQLQRPRLQRPQTRPLATEQSTHSGHAPIRHLSKIPYISSIPYIVRSGDSLWQIAQLFGVSIPSIQQANHLSGTFIHPGQHLQIELATVNGVRRSKAIRELRRRVPEDLIPVYIAAGRRYGIPWTVLAAIHKEESSFRTEGTIISCKGAMGPMQFMPSTFAIYGVTAPGRQGPPNINDVYDAIYSAAHMLAANGFRQNPFQALYSYNHSVQYVQDILHFAQL